MVVTNVTLLVFFWPKCFRLTRILKTAKYRWNPAVVTRGFGISLEHEIVHPAKSVPGFVKSHFFVKRKPLK